MGRRRRQLLIALAALVVTLLCWIFISVWFNRPPVYEGRTITEWSLDLLHSSPDRRTNAARVLETVGPDAIPALSRQLERRDSWLRAPFVAVSSLLPARWRRAFVRFYQPFRAMDERLAAVYALGLFATHAPVDLLAETLRSPERALANHASVVLARCGPAAVPPLTAALRDPNPEVRSLACSTLSQIGRSAAPAAPALVGLLSDPDPQLAAQAGHALVMIGPTAVPHLTQALDHPQPRVREKAVSALGQLGFPARSAIPQVERLLADPDPAVRKHARTALQALTPRAPP
jgi:hypothetical protein